MFQLFVSQWAFASCTVMRLEFWDLCSQQRFVGLTELKKYSAVKNLGDLCSVHFLPKGGWINVREITCFLSFYNILCITNITVPACILSSSPAYLPAYQLFWGFFCFILTLFWPRSPQSTLTTRMPWSPVKLICDTQWILHRKLTVSYSEIHSYYRKYTVFSVIRKIKNHKFAPNHHLLFYIQ